MVHLEQVTAKNVWDIVKLKVSPAQERYVAANDVSIIESYTTITAHGYALPFGIYDGTTPVGFVLIGFDVDDYWDDAPEIAKGNYNLWRLMIDEAYQGKGYGTKAVQLVLEYVRTAPCGKGKYCWLTYEPDNTVARQIYKSFGFVDTGEKDGEEIIAALQL